MKQRYQSIDVLKGIGIFLVLVAHSLGGAISHFAYTFHMPLFFIVTGLFMKPYLADFGTLRKDFGRLVGPAVFTSIIVVAVCSLGYALPYVYLQNPMELLWGGDSRGWWDVNMLGNLWFLFALFFSKMSFYCIAKVSDRLSVLVLLSFIIGGITLIVSRYVYLPFMIFRGICVLPFIAIGYSVRQMCYTDGIISFTSLSSRVLAVITIVMWGAYLLFCDEVVLNFSWGYIPDILAACGGTLVCYYVSNAICRYTHLTKKVFNILGVYSLLLICGPTIETYCFPMQIIMPDMPMRFLFVVGGKVLWCIVFVFMCVKIPILRKVYGVR